MAQAAQAPNATQKEEVEHAKPDVTLTLQHHGQLELAQANSSETYHLHASQRPHQSFIDHGLFSGETFKIRPVSNFFNCVSIRTISRPFGGKLLEIDDGFIADWKAAQNVSGEQRGLDIVK